MVDAAPWWVTLSAAAIRRLPCARYRTAHALGRLRVAPFLMRLPADAGHQLFVCDLRDAIAREVCFTGRYEPQETQLANALLRPGMTVIDAGAHWGYFTLVCAHRVGPGGRVLSLEPDARLMALLRANAAANRLTNVECISAAAARRRGTAPFSAFRESHDNWGISRIVAVGEAADCEVPTIALDELIADRSCGRIDLVKIDVEGAEGDVLHGMAEGLRASRYTHVLLECHPALVAERGGSLPDCLEPLRAAGYRGWSIDHSPAMHRRAAVTAVETSALLRPVSVARLESEPWPHTLWCAPGVTPF